MHPLPPPPGRSTKARDQPSETARPPMIPESSTANHKSQQGAVTTSEGGKKKKRHRAGKKKRNRRQSFAAPSEDSALTELQANRPVAEASNLQQPLMANKSLYRLGNAGGNLSSTSLDSEALLDHRTSNHSYRQDNHPSSSRVNVHERESDGEEHDVHDRTPLLSSSSRARRQSDHGRAYGLFSNHSRPRLESSSTSSSRKRKKGLVRESSYQGYQGDYDVNNPPSVPTSPQLGATLGYDDVLVGDFPSPRPPELRHGNTLPNDSVINIDGDAAGEQLNASTPPSPRIEPGDLKRRRTVALPVEDDVCFPTEGISEIAEEDFLAQNQQRDLDGVPRRRRRRQWPDLSVLEEWSREEKEERSEGIRAKTISEPVLVGGRLRPQKAGWHKVEEDMPYRFTYFNEEFPSTIHAQTISELVQPGGNFQELFIPEPPELEDYSSDEDYDEPAIPKLNGKGTSSPASQSVRDTRQSSLVGDLKAESRETSGEVTPQKFPITGIKPKRYGARPTFWLDVLCPTDAEMRVISKAFGIHALTAEDILMEEAREKVELFRNYYFINYRTFEQDQNSDNYLEPVNMYVVVFREGVLSFHFSQSPHPANVRRRIRQLKDYLILTSDWISYAIIDDITDVFQPLIQSIEDEVDDIDETILRMHSNTSELQLESNESNNGQTSFDEKASNPDSPTEPSGIDMLRRVGAGRKKVMGLYRLLGNKADVIKGFAKRCNEQWEVAPKSEIGLYLGDIQDHILTMTSNLSHYETLLSRAHSNYLAQINIRMNERQEKTADVLGKLTVLGTIVLPMNIICGMWGMNVKVPGQEVDNLYWFWSSKQPLSPYSSYLAIPSNTARLQAR
ncbi:MAG: hypothetical protein Q9160_007544 [Pyrenula sp. 1 TL-2023]